MRYNVGRFKRPTRRSTQHQLLSLLSLENLPAGVYGSSTAVNFIRQTSLNGIDIAVIGDSNTGFNAPTDGGYVWGLSYGLDVAFPNKCYGTPIYNLMIAGNFAGYKSSLAAASLPVGGYVSGIGSTDSGPTAITPLFSRGSGNWSESGGASATTYLDYPYLASGNQTENVNRGMSIASDHPIGVSNELRYRVLRGRFSGGGSHRYRVRLGASPFTALATSSSISANGTTAVIADETIVTAGSRSTGIEAFWSVQNAASIFNVGPIAPLLQSIYTPRVGWSVDSMYFFGGATLTTIDSDIGAAPSAAVQTMLREYYDRQIAAGGNGRLIVWIQGGANESDWISSPSTWLSKWNSTMNTIRSAWNSAGLPAGNLAFVAMVTHDISGYDFTSRRAELIGLASSRNDLTVVNIPEIIPFSSYSSFASGAHLSRLGYEAIGNAIINRMI
jgi:hypothetical protein